MSKSQYSALPRPPIPRCLNITDVEIEELQNTEVRIDEFSNSKALEILSHPTTSGLIEKYNITDLDEVKRRLPELYWINKYDQERLNTFINRFKLSFKDLLELQNTKVTIKPFLSDTRLVLGESEIPFRASETVLGALEILLHPTTSGLMEKYNITDLDGVKRRLPEFHTRNQNLISEKSESFDESLSRQEVKTAFNSLTKVSKKSVESGAAKIPFPPEIAGEIASYLGNKTTPSPIPAPKTGTPVAKSSLQQEPPTQ
jgi:hypothetical protein